jgi:hypothetical protein
MATEKVDRGKEKERRREVATKMVAATIRQKSEHGRLLPEREIRQDLLDQNIWPLDQEEEPDTLEAIFTEARQKNEDLEELRGESGKFYYSSLFMTGSYARLLLRKEGDPLLLIAECVRENSSLYPRPIPLTTFENSPFELTREEVHLCLKKMAEHADYPDIARTTTSAGTEYLYSTSHLDPNYASMLAEWFDVGQFQNP